ncbi:MAG: hypothetical protein K2M00_04165 [Muribaculaceae bacterium]|nr:hypothetical protein [Muribaculaceae bacterium]
MGKVLRKIFPFLLLGGAFAGCNTTGCLDNGSAIPLAGFYSSSTGGSISLDSLTVIGLQAPGDSALLRPGHIASSLYLPMRPGEPSTTWVIAYAYKAFAYEWFNDTVTFEYESIPYFASEECGAMYCYNIGKVHCTHHLIDSVALTDPLVTNVDIQTIKIYFRTASEEPQE